MTLVSRSFGWNGILWCSLHIYLPLNGKCPSFSNYKVPSNVCSWQRTLKCRFCSVAPHACLSLLPAKKPSTVSACFMCHVRCQYNQTSFRKSFEPFKISQFKTMVLPFSLQVCSKSLDSGSIHFHLHRFLVKHTTKSQPVAYHLWHSASHLQSPYWKRFSLLNAFNLCIYIFSVD